MTNRAGTAESTANLTVAKKSVKPSFPCRFTDMDVVKGEEVTFMCKIEGEPEPTVTWQHDRKPVTVSLNSICVDLQSV